MCGGHTRRPWAPRPRSLRTFGLLVGPALGWILLVPASSLAADSPWSPVRGPGSAHARSEDSGDHADEGVDTGGAESGARMGSEPNRSEPNGADVEEEDTSTPAPVAPSPSSVRATVDVVDSATGPRSPAATTRIDLRDRTRKAADLADLLDGIAGVHVRRLGGPGDPAWVGLRGSTARQVEVYLDGIPLNAGGQGAVDLSALPLAAWDSAEVSRGYAPFGLGAVPIGGTIELRSSPGPLPAPYVEVGYGSFATRRAIARGGLGTTLRDGTAADGLAVLDYSGTQGAFPYLDTGATPYDPYDDRTRKRANNDADRLALWGRARFVRGPFTVLFTEQVVLGRGGEPGPGHGVLEAARTHTHSSLSAFAVGIDPLGPSSVDLRGSMLIREEGLHDPLGEIGVGEQQSEDLSFRPGLDLVLRLRPPAPLRLAASMHLALDGYQPRDRSQEPYADGVRLRPSLSVGGSAQLGGPADRAQLEGAVQALVFDHRRLGATPWTGDPLALSERSIDVAVLPRLAGSVRPHDLLELRAAFALGHRPPDLQEIFGDGGSWKGNPDLRPEQGFSVDGGIRVRFAPAERVRVYAELGGYLFESRDTIVYVSNGQHVTVPVNFGHTRTAGIEAAAHLGVGDVLELDFAWTECDARILDSTDGHAGNQLPSVPPTQVDLSVEGGPSPWLRVGGAFSFFGPTAESASNAFIQPSRPRHDLFLRVQPGRRAPAVTLEVRNLLDTRLAPRFRNGANPKEDDREVVPLSDFRSYPLAGRSVMVTLNLPALSAAPGRTPKDP